MLTRSLADSFCMCVWLELLANQAKALARGRWGPDTIRVTFVRDVSVTIHYWLYLSLSLFSVFLTFLFNPSLHRSLSMAQISCLVQSLTR